MNRLLFVILMYALTGLTGVILAAPPEFLLKYFNISDTSASYFSNIGFLLIGAGISAFVITITEWVKRPQIAQDTKDAIHVELSDRLARCCYDFEHPWKYIATKETIRRDENLLKFAPVPPIIYPSMAENIALLPRDSRQRIVQFFFRLEIRRLYTWLHTKLEVA